MKRITSLIVVCFASISMFAQQDLSLYNLNEIPQSAYSNPSNQFNGTSYFGMPAISSNYLSFSNTGFAYSDAIVPRGNELLLDFNSMINELEDENYLSFNARVDLFSLGFSAGERTQITVNVSEVASFKFAYPKDFVRFVYEGNAAFEDNTADLDGLGINLMHYREYGVGVSHQLTQKLRLGGRAKFLYGMENIYSETTDISVTTDPQTFALTTNANMMIRTAGLDDVDDQETINDYLFTRANTGFAFDLGANYDLNDKLSLNASILDLGFISWNDFTTSYSVDGNFGYSGIEVQAFGDDDSQSRETSFDRIADSLEEAFQVDTTFGSYSSPLVGRFMIGANYKINERSFAGAIIQSEVFQSQLRPSFSLVYNRKMTKWITLGSSYSLINRSYNNLGFVAIFNPGTVQFYFASDNLLGAFQPQHARHIQARFGINFIFGSTKSTELRPNFRGVIESRKERKNEENAEESDSDS